MMMMMMMMMMWVPRVSVSIGSRRLGSRIDETQGYVMWMRTCLKIGHWFMLGWCAERRGRVSLKTEKKEVKETKSVYITRFQSGFQYFLERMVWR
jgi:hypothetical protein